MFYLLAIIIYYIVKIRDYFRLRKIRKELKENPPPKIEKPNPFVKYPIPITKTGGWIKSFDYITRIPIFDYDEPSFEDSYVGEEIWKMYYGMFECRLEYGYTTYTVYVKTEYNDEYELLGTINRSASLDNAIEHASEIKVSVEGGWVKVANEYRFVEEKREYKYYIETRRAKE